MSRISKLFNKLPWVNHTRGTLSDEQALTGAKSLVSRLVKEYDKEGFTSIPDEGHDFINQELASWMNTNIAGIKRKSDGGVFWYEVTSQDLNQVSQLLRVIKKLKEDPQFEEVKKCSIQLLNELEKIASDQKAILVTGAIKKRVHDDLWVD